MNVDIELENKSSTLGTRSPGWSEGPSPFEYPTPHSDGDPLHKDEFGWRPTGNSATVLPATEGGADEPAKTDEAINDFLKGWQLFLALTGVTVVMLLAMVDMAILGTAIPQITSDFNRLGDVGWYIGSYQLASATLQPLTGKMFTYFSSKWTFLFFFLIFEIGSAICGAAQSSNMLIAGRSIAGLGASGLINGCLTIIGAVCHPSSRPTYMGLAMGIGQLGVVAGPLLGGVFTEHASWRWCFYINLPLGGLAALFMVFTAIPDQIHKEPITIPYFRSLLPYFDLTGFALFAPASIMFLLALQWGAESYGWDSSEVIGLFCGAGATAALFCYWEWRVGEHAMIPPGVIKQMVVWTSCLNTALLMTTIIVGSNFMPIFLQSVKGLSPTMSGVYMLSAILSQMIFIIVSGALISKLGYYTPWAIFAAGISCVGCGLITTWTPSTTLGALLGYQVLLGSRGAGMQVGIIAIGATLPAKQVATGNAIFIFSQNFLGAVFITVANTIFQESLSSNILKDVPGVSPEDAIAAGGSASAVRELVPAGPLRDGVLKAYSDAFGNVFYLLVGTCAVAFVCAFGMGWKDLRKVNKEKEKTQESAENEAQA